MTFEFLITISRFFILSNIYISQNSLRFQCLNAKTGKMYKHFPVSYHLFTVARLLQPNLTAEPQKSFPVSNATYRSILPDTE